MKNKQFAQKAAFVVTAVWLAFTLWFCIYMAVAMIGAYNAKVDSVGDAIGKALGTMSVWIVFWLFGSFLSLFGFILTAVNRKKATIPIIRRFYIFCICFFGVNHVSGCRHLCLRGDHI